MYGWIHECFKGMIITYYGQEIWSEIILKSNITHDTWELQEYQPDQLFYNILSTTSAVLNVHENVITEMYGKYFLQFIHNKGYEKLLKCLGKNLFEWLSNVNQVHQHLLKIMTQMKPPNVWCEKINTNDAADAAEKEGDDEDGHLTSFYLYYQSSRGVKLLPIFVGIVTAVAKEYFHKIIVLELIHTQQQQQQQGDLNAATCWKVIEINEIQPDLESSESDSSDSILNDAIIELDTEYYHHHQAEGNGVFEEKKLPSTPDETNPSLEQILTSLSSPSNLKICPIKQSPPLEVISLDTQISVSAIIANEILGSNYNIPKLTLDVPRRTDNSAKIFDDMNSRSSTPRSSSGTSRRQCPTCKNYKPQSNTSTHYGLSSAQLHQLFPCHIVFDSNYQIIQVGSKIRQLLSNVGVGSYVNKLFDIKNHAVTWDKKWSDLSVILTSKPQLILQAHEKTSKSHQSLQLSGPITFSDDGRHAVFLCAPDINSVNELYDFNLTMTDIAIYGCRLQMVLQEDHLAQIQESNQQLKELTVQLQNEQQKRLQLMEEIANKANETLAIKQTFVRYISHEIRTPLSVATLGLLLLDQELMESQQMDQKFRTHIKECQDSLDIAVNILNDLLCYEKLDARMFELDKEITPVVEFVEESLELFSIQAKQKEIDLIFQNKLSSHNSVNLLFDIDKKKMTQVVRNFVSNALKFTPKHGVVTISVNYSPNLDDFDPNTLPLLKSTFEKTTNTEYSLAGTITVDFKDTGVGIDEENQTKLFHEFAQFSPGNSLQSGSGSGLGLWISKGIVARHHGYVGMHSEGVGHGSVFYMKLPVYTRTQPENLEFRSISPPPSLMKNFSVDSYCDSSEENEEENLALTPEAERDEKRRKNLFVGLKVLIVDDAPLVRKLMKNILTSKGAICDCAEDGVEAVQIITTSLQHQKQQNLDQVQEQVQEKGKERDGISTPNDYEIIFMDFMMPNMNGPEATKAIRSLGFKGLIIGVTGNMMTSDVNYFMESGANNILPKPLTISSLEDYLLTTLH